MLCHVFQRVHSPHSARFLPLCEYVMGNGRWAARRLALGRGSWNPPRRIPSDTQCRTEDWSLVG
eukprot:6688134-Prymnesium_polylepis.3